MAHHGSIGILTLALLIPGSTHGNGIAQTNQTTGTQGASTNGAAAPTGAAPIGATAPRTHNGSIADAPTGKPAEGVIATAYGNPTRDKAGLCPTYKDLLDTATTKRDGAFSLSIKPDRPVYFVTYCSPAYATRFAPSSNREDGSPVTPRPVVLFPRDGGGKAMASAFTVVTGQTRAQAITSRQADVAKFEASAAQLPQPERQLLNALIASDQPRQTNDQPERASPASTQVGSLTIESVLSDFRGTLKYFFRSNAMAFNKQITTFKDLSTYVTSSYLREEASRDAEFDDAITHTAAATPTSQPVNNLQYAVIGVPGSWNCQNPPPSKQTFTLTDTAIELWGEINNPLPGQRILLQWTEESFIPALVTSAPTEASPSSCLWARLPIAGTKLATRTASYRLEVRLSSSKQPAETWTEPDAVINFSIGMPGTQ